ncbi:MAG: c-type cytochrome [Gammaproteobacteria bacterium]
MGKIGVPRIEQSAIQSAIKVMMRSCFTVDRSVHVLMGFRRPVKALALMAMLLAGGGEIALAEPVRADDGDATAGKAKAAVCAACHGQGGNSEVANWPKLAEQNPRYIFKQLHDIKSGARSVPEMAPIVANLSEQDMADLSIYFSERSVTLSAVNPDLKDLGEKVYRSGVVARGVPACIACHGPQGKGVPSAGFPALSGQHPQYTAKQLMAFRAAARQDDKTKNAYRENDGDKKIMQGVTEGLTDDEIAAVSNYVSGLH